MHVQTKLPRPHIFRNTQADEHAPLLERGQVSLVRIAAEYVRAYLEVAVGMDIKRGRP
jgi:hypothetical protein